MSNPNHDPKTGEFSSSMIGAVGRRIEPIRNRVYSNGKNLIDKGTKRSHESQHNDSFMKIVNGTLQRVQAKSIPDVRKKYAGTTFIDDSVINFVNKHGYKLHGVKKI